MSFKNISPASLESLKAGLRSGQYNLLLGAGASMDSHNVFGCLPSGVQYKSELAKHKGVNDRYSLQQIYSLLKEQETAQYVTKRFADAAPGPSVKAISHFIWKRIFTWNIDTALEQAYKLADSRQNAASLHFSDGYVDADNLQLVNIVHLHGSTDVPEKGYVFSKNEYVNNIKNINHWMVILTQILQSEPVIISGSSLDEIDLEFYLSFRTPVNSRDDRGPSIFVTKDDDAIITDLCERHNLIHYVGYTNDFFEFCKKLIPNRPTPAELIPLEMRKLIPPGTTKQVAVAFQSDFELVPASVANQDQDDRFFYGHSPSWSDLARGLDVSRTLVRELITQVELLLYRSNSSEKIISISDTAGTGKSTILKRVAFELSKRGVRVLLCTAKGSLGRASSSIIDEIGEPVVLVVDNFADHVPSVVDLLSQVQKPDFIVIGAERSYRDAYVNIRMSDFARKDYNDLKLSDVEISRLVDSYLEKGMVGDGVNIEGRNAIQKSLKRDPIALACCRIMNDFKPIERIIEELVKASTQDSVNRYVTAAIARLAFSGGVRYSVLASVINISGIREQLVSNHPLPLAYADKSCQFVEPQNAVLSERVLALILRTDRSRIFDCFVALANGIAPRVNRKMIIQRSPEARLAGHLFDYDGLVRHYLKDDAERFYNKIQRDWKWNSRYWEQVALLFLEKSRNGMPTKNRHQYLENAVQHARHAVFIERHPFPLTTLGKVLMVAFRSNGRIRPEIFNEAVSNLNEAINLEARWVRRSPQPYISLLNGTMAYMEAGGIIEPESLSTLNTHILEAKERFKRDDEIRGLVETVVLRIKSAH